MAVVFPGDDIRAAVASLPQSGGVVRLAAGDHVLGPRFEGLRNVTFQGEGVGRTRIRCRANASYCLRVDRSHGVRLEGVSMYIGDSANFRRGFVATRCTSITVRDCHIEAGPATRPLWTPMGLLIVDTQHISVSHVSTRRCQLKFGSFGNIRHLSVIDVQAREPANFAISVVCGNDGDEMTDVYLRRIEVRDIFSSGALYLGDDAPGDTWSTRQERVTISDLTVSGSWPSMDHQGKVLLCRVGLGGWDGLEVERVHASLAGNRKLTSGVVVSPRARGGKATDVHLRDIYIRGTDMYGLDVAGADIDARGIVLEETRGVRVRNHGNAMASGTIDAWHDGQVVNGTAAAVHAVRAAP